MNYKVSDATKWLHLREVISTIKTYGFVGLIFCLIPLFAGCSASTSDITETVKQIMIEKTKEKGSDMKILELTLVKKNNKEYTGLAKCTIDGEELECDVNAVYDGNNVIAEWEPTAEYMQKAFENAVDEYSDEIEDAINSISENE